MSKFNKYLEVLKKNNSKYDNEDDRSENMDVGDDVKRGDYVDFGIYGKLWVVSAGEDRLWVTDIKKDRKNPNAQGWFIRRAYAQKILNED